MLVPNGIPTISVLMLARVRSRRRQTGQHQNTADGREQTDLFSNEHPNNVSSCA